MRDQHDRKTSDMLPPKRGRPSKHENGPMDAATRQAVSRAIRADKIAVAMRTPGTVEDVGLLADALKRANLDGNTRAVRRIAARIVEVVS